MIRWLAVGSEFSVHYDYSYDIKNWGERYNIKDYDATFFDLESLFADTDRLEKSSIGDPERDFPAKKAVSKNVQQNNDVFIRLPPERQISISASNGEPEEIDLLGWLPFEVHTDSSEEGNKVKLAESPLPEDGNTQRRSWAWYFKPPRFSWNMRITGVSPWPEQQPTYSNPTIRSIDEELDSLATRDRQPKKAELSKIATTNANEIVAAELILKTSQGHAHPGSVFLLPSRQEFFSQFVVDILQNWYGFEESMIRVDPTPIWTEEVPIAGEMDIKEQAEELESQAKALQNTINDRIGYKQMLYTNGKPLENIVRKAFREFGFNVIGEKPGKWDGVIQFDDREYLLEVTGTGGGIKEKKLSQLERHRRDYESARVDAEEVYTLLVANTFMNEHPADRKLNEGNFVGILQGTNKKVMTTKTLYSLLCAYLGEQLNNTDIRQMIFEGDSVIRYEGDKQFWQDTDRENDLEERVSVLINKITRRLL